MIYGETFYGRHTAQRQLLWVLNNLKRDQKFKNSSLFFLLCIKDSFRIGIWKFQWPCLKFTQNAPIQSTFLVFYNKEKNETVLEKWIFLSTSSLLLHWPYKQTNLMPNKKTGLNHFLPSDQNGTCEYRFGTQITFAKYVGTGIIVIFHSFNVIDKKNNIYLWHLSITEHTLKGAFWNYPKYNGVFGIALSLFTLI